MTSAPKSASTLAAAAAAPGSPYPARAWRAAIIARPRARSRRTSACLARRLHRGTEAPADPSDWPVGPVPGRMLRGRPEGRPPSAEEVTMTLSAETEALGVTSLIIVSDFI